MLSTVGFVAGLVVALALDTAFQLHGWRGGCFGFATGSLSWAGWALGRLVDLAERAESKRGRAA